MRRTGAALARHRSKQEVGTPQNFLAAVQSRFGRIHWDLAANRENSVAGMNYFGPGSTFAENSLIVPWSRSNRAGGPYWLNPPFGTIEPWAAKCATCRGMPRWTLLLVPAAVGSNWFQRHVAPNALVLELTDRITFVGQEQPYPKDLILGCFGFGVIGRAPWHWDESKRKRWSPEQLTAAPAAE